MFSVTVKTSSTEFKSWSEHASVGWRICHGFPSLLGPSLLCCLTAFQTCVRPFYIRQVLKDIFQWPPEPFQPVESPTPDSMYTQSLWPKTTLDLMLLSLQRKPLVHLLLSCCLLPLQGTHSHHLLLSLVEPSLCLLLSWEHVATHLCGGALVSQLWCKYVVNFYLLVSDPFFCDFCLSFT